MAEPYEFMRLTDVETAQEVQNTDTILIIQNDTVKKTPKDNVGAGVVYFVTSNYYFRTGTDWGAGEDVTFTDIVSAYKNGPVKIYQMSSGALVGVGEVVGYKMYNGAERAIWVCPATNSLQVIS